MTYKTVFSGPVERASWMNNDYMSLDCFSDTAKKILEEAGS